MADEERTDPNAPRGSMTYGEFGKLHFACPLCGSPVRVNPVDVTTRVDPEPMVMVGRYECTQRGCAHGRPVTPGCECEDCR